jgi:hypothetical protein
MLRRRGPFYRGVLPPEINIANTAIDWHGLRWTMVAMPLPEDSVAVTRLLMHESWHRMQHELGIPQSSPVPVHLSTAAARILMRLEWRALSRALTADGAASRRRAIADAIAFRAKRHSDAGPAGAEAERALELNEGLAEYTGLRLSASTNRRALAAVGLAQAEQRDSFARTFAYASGPGYGLLLDGADPRWRSRLTRDSDLALLLAEAARVEPAADLVAARERYGGRALADTEQAAEARRLQVANEWTALLVTGPVLRLTFDHMQIGFNPDNLVPIGGGTVYPTLRVSDSWGILEVTGGAFIDEGWGGVSVTAPPDGNAHQGPGWALTLKEGWSIAPGPRPGDFQLLRPDAARGGRRP